MELSQVWEDINNLNVEDLRRIGTAPKPIRVLAIVLVCLAVAGLDSSVFLSSPHQLPQSARAEWNLEDFQSFDLQRVFQGLDK